MRYTFAYTKLLSEPLFGQRAYRWLQVSKFIHVLNGTNIYFIACLRFRLLVLVDVILP